jgi:hypothetical protein
MLDLFGQALAPASRSAPPASSVAATMSATYGLRSSASSASVALQSSLVSRLPALLATHGGTMWQQTWKAKHTPQRRVISAHTVSAHHTDGSGFTGWPTPVVHDHTPQHQPDVIAKKARGESAYGLELRDAAMLAGWPTSCANKHGGTTRDWKDGATSLENTPINLLLGRQVLGAISNGSSAATAKQGQLNPAFSLWLMGYPVVEWLLAAPPPMRRQKLLATSSVESES